MDRRARRTEEVGAGVRTARLPVVDAARAEAAVGDFRDGPDQTARPHRIVRDLLVHVVQELCVLRDARELVGWRIHERWRHLQHTAREPFRCNGQRPVEGCRWVGVCRDDKLVRSGLAVEIDADQRTPGPLVDAVRRPLGRERRNPDRVSRLGYGDGDRHGVAGLCASASHIDGQFLGRSRRSSGQKAQPDEGCTETCVCRMRVTGGRARRRQSAPSSRACARCAGFAPTPWSRSSHRPPACRAATDRPRGLR